MATILCVEDEAAIRANIVDEFKDAGYEVFEASDGKEGLAAALAHKPDLVLCDISMPNMDGLELLSKFRKRGSGLEEIPFIFLTALSDRENMISGLDKGADDYLTKPVDFDLLLAKVKACLRQINRMLDKKRDEHVRLYKALSQSPAEKSEQTETEIQLTSPPLSVVLVGKGEPELNAVQMILESRGNSVRVFFSGKEFVAEVDHIETDIVLMSFNSNDMQAPISAKLGKRIETEKEVPYVLMWPEDMKELPNPARLKSFNHVLRFPCPESEIMEKIEMWANEDLSDTDEQDLY